MRQHFASIMRLPEKERMQEGWRQVTYDLHLHSCLSPCAEDDMTPANIVGMAVVKELDVVALTDHNTCKNCPAFLKTAEQYGITALPGMELTTAEEVHVLCLFAELSDALRFDAYVYEHLLDIKNEEKIFGTQIIRGAEDEELGRVEKLLINATDIGFDEVYDLMVEYGGVMIPAHLDKSTTSLLSNLGAIPPDSRFTAAEIRNPDRLLELQEKHPYLKNCTMITNSDAHFLPDIQEPVRKLFVPELTPEGVLAALKTAYSKNDKEG